MIAAVLLTMSAVAAPGPVDLTTVTSDLDQPTSVIAAPGGGVLVTQKGGRIVKVSAAGKVTRWFRIPVSTDGERGLLSVAPIDAKRFYAAYTDGAGALQVSRFTKGGGERKIIRIKHPRYNNHNGGQVALHEGLLYISTGDGGGSGDPFRAAGNPRDLRGKILRIDPTCGGKKYCIPAGNPRRSPVIAMGLRNPWRFSIDPTTETLWIGDVGQDAVEEIDRMPLTGPRVDFGWSCWEGPQRYDRTRCAGRTVTAPLLSYGHNQGQSVTGGYVYRGAAIPTLRGWYVFGDFASGRIWAYRDGQRKRLGTAQGVTAFGVDPDGELLLTTIDGRLLRLRA
jgi:glucose/arabinose dehydrogenase